jgi:diguanylate cyclase (GGDEF)-like protein
MLRALCGAATRAVGVDGIGLMLADGQALRFVHAEPAWVVDVERLQEQYGRGPCWDSLRFGQAVVVQDARTAERWPELARRARSEGGPGLGFGAVASLPLLAQDRSWGVLDLYRTAPGPWIDADLAAAALFTQVAASYLVMAADRDAWHTAWEHAQHSSTHDELTGLPTRGLLMDRLDHAIAASTRRGGAVAVLFLDIDAFKTVNDAYGHAVGDATLVEVAHRLGSTLRSNDTLARLSGDEFVIVCEDLDIGLGHVHDWINRLGERILLELRRPARPGESNINVSVSIGAAVTTRDCSAQTLTAQADHAMYAAKHSGGGRLVISRTGPPLPPPS